ncbi:hypothetical protein GO755_02745 [Spirosoma sp. HMF4905]|uniref:Lipoprotein n=1 Tax=Spirosoma arboris TaxID=2682092 RepID=A0A7K1S5L6_9BACT|nr:hypothetical protein [Spirosoma arboris]MVM28936.1 hypothetical protein [Spirosoma arboris]
MLDSVKWFSGFLIVGATLFSSCKSSDSQPTDLVSVGLHQSARLASEVVVRVDSIQDSRCPTGATCVWAGQAKVKMLLSKDKDSTAVSLILGPSLKADSTKRIDSTNVTLSNQAYKVILRDVYPYPTVSTQGQPQAAVVQVTKI